MAAAEPRPPPSPAPPPIVLPGMTVCGVSREATIADYGLVLSGELDDGDSMLYVAAATDAAGASGLSVAEVLFDPGPRYARRFGGMWHAGVDVVGQ